MAELVASDLTVAVAFGAAGAILVALATFIVALIVDAIGDGDAVGDVQRFIELSAVGRYSLLPHGPLLSDPDGETSAAISQLLAKKEEARRALWDGMPLRSLLNGFGLCFGVRHNDCFSYRSDRISGTTT
jgi:hypothetical protein